MATFSPSPAPRRSSRLGARGTSPPRRTRVGHAGPSLSRLGTPHQPVERLPFINDNVSLASGMDVDDSGSVLSLNGGSRRDVDLVFAKSDEMVVTFYANLPVEVKQVLRTTDFYRNPYVGSIDTLTGFAVVLSAQTCFVWQHAQAIKGTPTCYIFSCPRDVNQIDPPLHALVPYGSSREPGLILISPSGEIRFWDSIGIGLAGGDHYTTTNLALNEEAGEEINNLVRSDPQAFVASTTSGNLFRLTLTSTGGKYHLTSHAFSRPAPQRSFSSLFPSIFTSSSGGTPDAFECVYSIALGNVSPTGEQEVWAVARRRVQKWVMKTGGWEELVLEYDLADLIEPAVEDAFKANYNLDLEMLDAAVDGDGKLVILMSHLAEDASSTGMDLSADVRRIYALARVLVADDNFTIEGIHSVPYQSTFTSGVNVHARIQLLFGGSIISIKFGDAVALCARDSEFQDRLELKSVTDRTLGVGVNQNDNTLLVLTATIMMKVTLDVDKIAAFQPETGRTNLIKSIMMQAILYGALPENPLYFSFPPEVDEESLMRGAEQLSQSVLSSDPEVVQRNHDLSAQLIGRKERLSWLIRFINENTVLGKISQRSRQKLATDAEKLFACQQLWIEYNKLLSTNVSHSVLNDAVHAYMEEVGDGPHEDVMRAFFRLRVADIGILISKVQQIAKITSRETGRDFSECLPEANRIVVTVLRSAFDYRGHNLQVYGIELPMINPWTSRPGVIEVVLALLDETTKVVESGSRSSNASNSAKELSKQLPDLTAILFECIQERLNWLDSPAAADEPGTARDLDTLVQRFDLLRPEMLETLRKNGHENSAFALAEHYRDFSTLAALCHKDKVYPPEQNPNAARLESYIDRFKEDFTKALYQWYIQHGELRLLFSQEDMHGPYIDKFFAENPNNAISWIYDLGQARYAAVASALMSEAQQAPNLEVKHLMLSIGKLSHLAQLHETNAQADEDILDTFHDELDFVSVHEALLKEFRSALEGVRGRHSLESQIDIVVKAKATRLKDKKALTQVFKDLLRQLFQAKALSVEDAVDLLTLKDNLKSVEDYSTALHLLERIPAANLPEARKLSAFKSVWRRIYIHDDWDAIQKTANISDTEVLERYKSTALYATLCMTVQKEYAPEGFETSPNKALEIPTREEIVSRWPGMSPDQVESIIQDYNLECDTLGELNLEDVYPRVREQALVNTSNERQW